MQAEIREFCLEQLPNTLSDKQLKLTKKSAECAVKVILEGENNDQSRMLFVHHWGLNHRAFKNAVQKEGNCLVEVVRSLNFLNDRSEKITLWRGHPKATSINEAMGVSWTSCKEIAKKFALEIYATHIDLPDHRPIILNTVVEPSAILYTPTDCSEHEYVIDINMLDLTKVSIEKLNPNAP